jgi:hypothetical protein
MRDRNEIKEKTICEYPLRVILKSHSFTITKQSAQANKEPVLRITSRSTPHIVVRKEVIFKPFSIRIALLFLLLFNTKTLNFLHHN